MVFDICKVSLSRGTDLHAGDGSLGLAGADVADSVDLVVAKRVDEVHDRKNQIAHGGDLAHNYVQAGYVCHTRLG